MKNFLILALLAILIYMTLGQNPLTVVQTTIDNGTAQIDSKLHPTDCGAAPGAVGLGERIAWGLCESAKSASEDQKAGR